jgi:hypothetical protein
LQVQSLWVRNLSSAYPEASPCLSGMLCHSEDATPPWWLYGNIVQSSKQYFSHCIYCVYAQVCGVCLFSTSGMWVDLSHEVIYSFTFPFMKEELLRKRYVWSHIVIGTFLLVWNLRQAYMNCIHCYSQSVCSGARLSK